MDDWIRGFVSRQKRFVIAAEEHADGPRWTTEDDDKKWAEHNKCSLIWRPAEDAAVCLRETKEKWNLRAQQVLQDVLVLNGRRPVVFTVLFDLLIGVLLPEERHLALWSWIPRGFASRLRVRNVYTYICIYSIKYLSHTKGVPTTRTTALRLPCCHSLRAHREQIGATGWWLRVNAQRKRELLSPLPRLIRCMRTCVCERLVTDDDDDGERETNTRRYRWSSALGEDTAARRTRRTVRSSFRDGDDHEPMTFRIAIARSLSLFLSLSLLQPRALFAFWQPAVVSRASSRAHRRLGVFHTLLHVAAALFFVLLRCRMSASYRHFEISLSSSALLPPRARLRIELRVAASRPRWIPWIAKLDNFVSFLPPLVYTEVRSDVCVNALAACCLPLYRVAATAASSSLVVARDKHSRSDLPRIIMSTYRPPLFLPRETLFL